jgi:hypothetical protein
MTDEGAGEFSTVKFECFILIWMIINKFKYKFWYMVEFIIIKLELLNDDRMIYNKKHIDPIVFFYL